ncbi:MAG: DNA repair and recombination protein RadB [Candidatus Thermoplasmatota archaeon]|nr:DNA repair and recombination protein RadB [Candidatus Thermoplasmatota archaeon]MBU1941389.1 DNA repair and recombination protein RadB [Candidatus Thermoplasmatota archaeon]
MTRLLINCSSLDSLLGGGLESGMITKFYGEAATGKTNICLQAAKEFIISGGSVAYIDTEGVSIERLRQICGNTPVFKTILKKIMFYRPMSFEEQQHIITDIVTKNDFGLIIIDTINLFYRLHLDRDKDDIMRTFSRMVATLLKTARQQDIYIIITEQVYTDKTGDIKPFTTRETEHLAKTIILLEKTGVGERKATIIRHRSEPEGNTATFFINQQGLTTPPSETKP